MNESKILQLIPADGWSAQYADGFKTVAAWALVEYLNAAGDPYREVIGLVLEDGNYNPVYADSLPEFQKYRRIYALLNTEDQKPKKGKKGGVSDDRSYI